MTDTQWNIFTGYELTLGSDGSRHRVVMEKSEEEMNIHRMCQLMRSGDDRSSAAV